MQLAYQTIGFHDASLEETFRVVAEAGFDAVHLAPWRTSHIQEATANGIARVRELAETFCLSIQAVGVHGDPAGGGEFAEEFDLAVAIAEDAGVDVIALQPGRIGERDRADAIAAMAENLKAPLELAAAKGLRVSVEPVNQYEQMWAVRELADFLQLTAATGEPEHLGMHCDIMWLMNGRYIDELPYSECVNDLLSFLKQYGGRLIDVGIHWLDDIVPFGLSGWQGVYTSNNGPAGPWWCESYDSSHRQWVNVANVTFHEVVGTLGEMGFDRPLVMEYENVYARQLDDAAIAARRICNQAKTMLSDALR